jgi:polyisoprenoid-binding protein YceI
MTRSDPGLVACGIVRQMPLPVPACTAGISIAGWPATLLTILSLTLATAPAWGAAAWAFDSAMSKLTFVATQAGGDFEGRFRRFTPIIVFDSTDLAHSRFTVDIDTTTADTGEPDRDDALKGKDFFAAAQWPKAHFETTAFRATGPGAFVATGTLTVRNVSRAVQLPFTFNLAMDGKSAALVGGTTVRRLDYGVGQGEWSDTKWIGNEVRIRFELALRRTPP